MTSRLLGILLITLALGCQSTEKFFKDVVSELNPLDEETATSGSSGTTPSPTDPIDVGPSRSDEPSEPSNDTPEGAARLWTSPVIGEIGKGNDRADWWRIDIREEGYLAFEIKNLRAQNVEGTYMGPAELFDSGQVQKSQAQYHGKVTAGHTFKSNKTIFVAAGTHYFIKVNAFGRGNSAKYELKVVFQPE